MRHTIKFGLNVLTLIIGFTNTAFSNHSTRIPLLKNNEVTAWKTIIYPNTQQILKMHRHEHNRVVIALTDGTLKITDNKGKIHYLKLKNEHAYYLTKDIPGELHTDENMSKHPIKVIVVELRR